MPWWWPSYCGRAGGGYGWIAGLSELRFLLQEVLLQLVQQGVGFPHAGFLDEGRLAHPIECLPPYGFKVVPEFPPDGFDLLFKLPPRSFDFAFELAPHCAPRRSIRNATINETIKGVFWTARLQSNGNCRRWCPPQMHEGAGLVRCLAPPSAAEAWCRCYGSSGC